MPLVSQSNTQGRSRLTWEWESAGVTAVPGLRLHLLDYNQGRPHSALDGRTPDTVYFASLPQREAG